jgi:hypothetical protein
MAAWAELERACSPADCQALAWAGTPSTRPKVMLSMLSAQGRIQTAQRARDVCSSSCFAAHLE